MYEELIRRLREEPLNSNKAALPIMDLCIDAATAIENLSHRLDMAQGERDAVTRHMIELEQEVGRLRKERDAAAQCIRDKCKHIESTEYGCRCDLYDSPCDGCEDGWSRRKEA